MALKSKFFRIATEGDTSDGRVIDRRVIQEVADTYDRNKYAARIWMEHIRSYTADGPFRAYGDVLALQARQVEDGKLALFAQIEPLPELVSLNQAKQKLYTSMEVAPNFAKSGKAYLVGLGVTDSPASLGTEMLTFAAQQQANPLAARKQDADNFFSAAQVVELTFEEQADKAHEDTASESLAARVLAIFSKSREEIKPAPSDTAQQKNDTAQTLIVLFNQIDTLDKNVATLMKQAAERNTREQTLLAQLQEVRSQFDSALTALKTQDVNPASQRQPATGGANPIQTDC